MNQTKTVQFQGNCADRKKKMKDLKRVCQLNEINLLHNSDKKTAVIVTFKAEQS